MTRSASAKTSRHDRARRAASSRPMLTYWLPWPGKRKAILPGGGPLPRKMPCACKRLPGRGLVRRRAPSAPSAAARPARPGRRSRSPAARGAADVGRVGRRRRAASSRPARWLQRRRPAGPAAPPTVARAERQDAAQRRLAGWRRCAPCDSPLLAPLVASSAGPRRRMLRLRCVSSARDVLLEHDVEVRAAEAVGADAARGAACRSRRGHSRSSWFR